MVCFQREFALCLIFMCSNCLNLLGVQDVLFCHIDNLRHCDNSVCKYIDVWLEEIKQMEIKMGDAHKLSVARLNEAAKNCAKPNRDPVRLKMQLLWLKGFDKFVKEDPDKGRTLNSSPTSHQAGSHTLITADIVEWLLRPTTKGRKWRKIPIGWWQE